VIRIAADHEQSRIRDLHLVSPYFFDRIHFAAIRRNHQRRSSDALPRILIVDDNSMARTTIRGLLDWHSFQICGEAQDGKDAITKVMELKPDIVLLDINMPGMNGVNAAYGIRRISTSTKIVFLTIHDTPAARHNTQLWSHGFVSKSDAGTELIPISGAKL
jgi:CheY-like chemotaxis protein